METENFSGLPVLSKAGLKLLGALALKKYRRREGLFVAEGVRLVEEALAAGAGINWAVVADAGGERLPGDRALKLLGELQQSGVNVYRAGEKDLRRVLDAVQPQAVAAVCRIERLTLEDWQVPGICLLVVCDGLKEPGNLGSVIRAAAAGGADAVLVGPGTVDPFSPKCVRAGAGSLFRLPVFEVDSADKICGFLLDNGFSVFEAAAGGEDLFAVDRFPGRTALILGSEAEGISPAFAGLGGRKLAVPMSRGVESLNVAVAAGVILYEISRRKGRC